MQSSSLLHIPHSLIAGWLLMKHSVMVNGTITLSIFPGTLPDDTLTKFKSYPTELSFGQCGTGTRSKKLTSWTGTASRQEDSMRTMLGRV
ncbi:hypothetical protein BD324DRAFT_362583 [Kockovaella imperatae]|uniref:Uncharacterized protein n=1 Tax=Kockovaella imperatae TaxID=4999 RepID=A0A1Y1UMZ8_9TREE|nr:hypothetical protein BD324DRAFT_362583 [Kockovaella imperatae]ORX38505.1 hypothetical protein BD324DRAFT_362583 [Kockovaella imperatae]